MKKLILAVDFDGTICKEAFPGIGEPLKDAFKYLQKLKDDNHELILWTCRNNDSLDDAIAWLERWGCFVFTEVNRNTETWKSLFPEYAQDEPSNKVFADVYLEDKIVGGFTGWENAYNYITKLAKGD